MQDVKIQNTKCINLHRDGTRSAYTIQVQSEG